MEDKVNLTEEMDRMRNLFGYESGKVISEQLQNKNIIFEQNLTNKDILANLQKGTMGPLATTPSQGAKIGALPDETSNVNDM